MTVTFPAVAGAGAGPAGAGAAAAGAGAAAGAASSSEPPQATETRDMRAISVTTEIPHLLKIFMRFTP